MKYNKLESFFIKAGLIQDPTDRYSNTGTLYPIPKMVNEDIDLTEVIDSKTIELSKKYDTIYLMWSGGIDSTTALFSFIKNKLPLTVLITGNSIKEYPSCHNDIINGAYPNIKFINVKDTNDIVGLDLENSTILTGELGDQVMGSALTMFYSKRYREMHYSQILAEEFTDLTEESIISLLGTADLNVGEYLWAINFIFKYENVYKRIAKNYKDLLNTDIPVEHFFHSDGFQLWSIQKYKEHANYDNKYLYKIAFKEYIHSVNGDDLYLKYKRKLDSLQHSKLYTRCFDHHMVDSCLTILNKPGYEDVSV